jgi:AcrR family transcriptional regulator
MSEPIRSAAGRGRGRPRDPGADEAILRAALELFAERGVEGTSIEQIAKRAGVARLTVYRRWDSKEELIAQAIETAREGILDPSSLEDDDTPLARLIERMVEESVEPLADPGLRALTARLIGSGTSHPSLLETYWEHYVVPRRRRSRAILERARREGMLAEDADVEVVIDMMVGAVMYRLLVQPGQPGADEIRRHLEAVIRQAGLRLPERS